MNTYHGVFLTRRNDKAIYRARIHVRSYYLIGYYDSAVEAAVAYNKAVDIVKERYPEKNYELNYIAELKASEYAALYKQVKISDKIYHLPV